MRPQWLSDDCPDRRGGGGGAGSGAGGGGGASGGGSGGLPRYNLQAVVTHVGKHSHGEFCAFPRF